MPDITFIHPDGAEYAFEAPEGVSLMQAAAGFGVPGIVADCRGELRCATCHVYVEDAWAGQLPPPSPAEQEMLSYTACERGPTSRLSCQIVLTAAMQGLTVRLPEWQQ